MADERKIRIMATLAVYDKYYGEKDRKIDANYRWDYIYKKNCFNRICVTMGYLVILALYALYLIFVEEINLATFDVMAEAKRLGIIWLFLMAAYTLFGIFLYSREYNRAIRRLESYSSLVDRLEEYNRQ